jgi:hypothetical protein
MNATELSYLCTFVQKSKNKCAVLSLTMGNAAELFVEASDILPREDLKSFSIGDGKEYFMNNGSQLKFGSVKELDWLIDCGYSIIFDLKNAEDRTRLIYKD